MDDNSSVTQVMGGNRGRPRILGRAILILLLLSFLFFRFDTLALSPIEKIALSHLFDLSGWEATNFFQKWWLKAGGLVTLRRPSPEEGRSAISEYFSLTKQENEIKAVLDRNVASGADVGEIRSVEDKLRDVSKAREKIRNAVEEALESELSSVLRQEGIPWALGPGGAFFPPVDFRFDRLPHILVVSPRDRILRGESLLLKSGMRTEEMEALEADILGSQNLSAIVDKLGGLGSYPSLVRDSTDLRSTLHTTAHEWLHQYLFFRPLGQNFGSSSDMMTLNETLADIAGREMGDLVYRRLGYTLGPTPDQQDSAASSGDDEEVLDFSLELHETRLRVDELLAGGKIEEAEGYMEERRQFLAANGYYIRKLNQAYFAFHGTYAESPSSVSPIDNQLKELRRLTPSVGEFIDLVADVSSYTEFLELFQEMKGEAER